MFRTASTVLLMGSLCASDIQAAPIAYTIDPDHTQTIFSWSHFGFSNPVGNFNAIRGTIDFDAGALAKSSVAVTIAVDSMDTHVGDLDKHLKTAEFLNASVFPTISFKSARIEETSDRKHFKVIGDLTIHGVTKVAVLDASINKVDKKTIGFNATTTLKRSDFGVGAYAPNVGDEIKVNVTTEAYVPEA